MRIVVQRSLHSKVSVDNQIVGEIDKGLVLLVGFQVNDSKEDIDYLVKKVANLRIFDDENGVMNQSIQEVDGSILSISQFTLYGDTRKGNRPSYVHAMNGERAKPLYEYFNESLRNLNITVAEGIFGADMKVSITNDGPVTILLESRREYD